MGPHFLSADQRVGRRRLPPGYVVVLEDPERLRLVTAELHAYALAEPIGVRRPQYGVLFRRVSVTDRETVRHKLIAEFGAAALLRQAAPYSVRAFPALV